MTWPLTKLAEHHLRTRWVHAKSERRFNRFITLYQESRWVRTDMMRRSQRATSCGRTATYIRHSDEITVTYCGAGVYLGFKGLQELPG